MKYLLIFVALSGEPSPHPVAHFPSARACIAAADSLNKGHQQFLDANKAEFQCFELIHGEKV